MAARTCHRVPRRLGPMGCRRDRGRPGRRRRRGVVLREPPRDVLGALLERTGALLEREGLLGAGDVALMGEQPRLVLDATAEAGEVAGARHDAVARYDDADRVAAVRRTDRTCLADIAELAGLLAVRHRRSVRDRAQHLPGGELERGAGGVERQGEAATGAREVLAQLYGELVEDRVRALA